ncbi:MAG: hypothetical protein ABIT38_03755 [Gemmatimonadaceae bacterium]
MSEFTIGIEDQYAWANLVCVTTSGPNEILLDKIYHQALTQAAAQLNLRYFISRRTACLHALRSCEGRAKVISKVT